MREALDGVRVPLGARLVTRLGPTSLGGVLDSFPVRAFFGVIFPGMFVWMFGTMAWRLDGGPSHQRFHPLGTEVLIAVTVLTAVFFSTTFGSRSGRNASRLLAPLLSAGVALAGAYAVYFAWYWLRVWTDPDSSPRAFGPFAVAVASVSIPSLTAVVFARAALRAWRRTETKAAARPELAVARIAGVLWAVAFACLAGGAVARSVAVARLEQGGANAAARAELPLRIAAWLTGSDSVLLAVHRNDPDLVRSAAFDEAFREATGTSAEQRADQLRLGD